MSNIKITLSEIIKWHESRGGVVSNFGLSQDHKISHPRAIDLCNESNISLLTKKYKGRTEELLSQTKCKLIIIEEEMLPDSNFVEGKTFLFHENPKRLLIEFCKEFLAFEAPIAKQNISPTAIIETGAKIGQNNIIGDNVFISKNSEIGDYCVIGQNSIIKNCIVNDNVKIGCNNTIGENGFGYDKNKNGEVELFPHYGGVVIEDNVHIGNNNCIDRGSLSDTVIKKGVKIDNLIHIAHNVIIEENALVIACSMIAGSVVIGKNSWVAPSSTIRNAVNVGSDTTIGLGSVVTKNVENGQTVLGNPAMLSDDFFVLRKQQKSTLENYRRKSQK